ncbi:MAG TPA: MgtC/SapB family protein [Rhizomicrobium sp.]|jgi:putative Mg2+ transporter-C (MgtC) family protein
MENSLFDVFLRLGAATLAGMVLGLNRDLRGKPTGIRTLGLVSLGVAIATVAVLRTEQAVSDVGTYGRVLQGIVQGVLTGIGFLGGGVILRSPETHSVRNLTTAATVWVTAAIGIACSVASWPVLGMGLFFAIALLAIGDSFDKAIAKWYKPRHDETHPKEMDRSQK